MADELHTDADSAELPGSSDAGVNTPAPYAAPRLIVYGSLSDLTRATGKSSNMDGGSGQMSRSLP